MSESTEIRATLAAVVREHDADMYEDWCRVCGPSLDEDGYPDHIARLQVEALRSTPPDGEPLDDGHLPPTSQTPDEARAYGVRCPRCLEGPGRRCNKGVYVYRPTARPHRERYASARGEW